MNWARRRDLIPDFEYIQLYLKHLFEGNFVSFLNEPLTIDPRNYPE